MSFILLVLVAILLCLLLKATKNSTIESKDEVEEKDDPLPTLAGPRPSDNDIRVPKVKQTADSTAMSLAGGNKCSRMPLNTDVTPNRGMGITFEATSF